LLIELTFQAIVPAQTSPGRWLKLTPVPTASALSDAAVRMRKLRGCSQMRSLIKVLDARRITAEEGATLKAA
jgi:hypothetical protein